MFCSMHELYWYCNKNKWHNGQWTMLKICIAACNGHIKRASALFPSPNASTCVFVFSLSLSTFWIFHLNEALLYMRWHSRKVQSILSISPSKSVRLVCASLTIVQSPNLTFYFLLMTFFLCIFDSFHLCNPFLLSLSLAHSACFSPYFHLFIPSLLHSFESVCVHVGLIVFNVFLFAVCSLLNQAFTFRLLHVWIVCAPLAWPLVLNTHVLW